MENTRKRKQKLTLSEFRAWLQGVEELQSDEWCPNLEQWRLIRDKINGIVTEKVVVETTPVVNRPHYQQPTNVNPAALPAPAPAVGGVPVADVAMSSAASEMLNPGGAAAKTPDIDTSDGNVNSSFA